MTPTPPSTSSSTGGHSPDGPESQYRVVRKRNRVPLSCAACRHRKLKCNRTSPCENCVRRGDAASCSYATPGTRKKSSSASNGSSSTPDDMQNRIDRLEGLVLSLMTNGSGSAGPAAAAQAISTSTSDESPMSGRQNSMQEDNDMIREEGDDESDTESVTNSFGILKVDNEKGKSMYVGDSHWHLVLADIAEVKSYFANHAGELDAQYKKVAFSNPSTALGSPAFLFGAQTQVSEGELRAALPNRNSVEKLVGRYFNSYDSAVNIIHYPTFHKQLQTHYKDPTKTSVVWIALLNSILCLAMQSYHKIGDEPPEWKGKALSFAAEYRLRCVQCLVLADYTKCADNTIEALLLYVHGEYTSRWDAEVGIWAIISVVIRLAMRMGYHRDPEHFPGVSPFKGEMRRRVWSFLRMMDIIFSFQLALPNMIKSRDCDVKLPRNLFEEELREDMTELPPARPDSESTTISYMLAKVKLGIAFGDVVEEVNSVASSTGYDEVMRKDNKLREVRNSLPAHLHLRPLEESLNDPAVLLMERYGLDILYQKAMCVLHRKYLVRARTNQRYAHSRRACVEAGMEILRHQATLHRESQIGGRMRSVRWFINSLTKHDYLLGAMIVCLDLHYDSLAEPYNVDKFFWTSAQRKNMYDALQTSQSIWALSAETSMEAYKASRILGIMLEKLQQEKSSSKFEPQTTKEAFAAFDDNQPEHSAAMTLGMLSSGGLTPNTAAMFANTITLTPGGKNIDMMDTTQMSTGMTPNYIDSSVPMGGMFGDVNGLPGMMDMPSNLNWVSIAQLYNISTI